VQVLQRLAQAVRQRRRGVASLLRAEVAA